MLKQRKPMQRTAMKKGGKKTSAWAVARQELKQEFLANGIIECELNYPGCKRNNYLSFAHARKRRHLATGELKDVILACTEPCHAIIERLSPEKMYGIVMQVIEKRNHRLKAGGVNGRVTGIDNNESFHQAVPGADGGNAGTDSPD